MNQLRFIHWEGHSNFIKAEECKGTEEYVEESEVSWIKCEDILLYWRKKDYYEVVF